MLYLPALNKYVPYSFSQIHRGVKFPFKPWGVAMPPQKSSRWGAVAILAPPPVTVTVEDNQVTKKPDVEKTRYRIIWL